KDGMNLVAKEFCASSLEDKGVLILSEYAGATAQFQEHALLVNPYDVEGVADAIHQAATMDDREQRRRMRALRAICREKDIFWWVDTFLKGVTGDELLEEPVDAFRPRPPKGFLENG